MKSASIRHWNSFWNQVLSRREMLRTSSAGFGGLALAALLGEEAAAAQIGPRPDSGSGVDPLAPRPPHFAPRAKRVIFLFMHGGPSQVDTFDYKPLLQRDHGKPLPFKRPRVVSSETFNLLKSPWEFKQRGESGLWVSELFPISASSIPCMVPTPAMVGRCWNSTRVVILLFAPVWVPGSTTGWEAKTKTCRALSPSAPP